MERGNTNSLLHEWFQEDKEKLNGVKAQMALLAGEGRSEGESGQGEPGSGATATEGKGIELNGDGPSAAAAAADLTENFYQENQGHRGSGQESDKQPKEPALMDMEGTENVMHVPVLKSRVQPASVLLRQCCFKYKLAPWQLRELERIFKQNHFLSGLERKRPINTRFDIGPDGSIRTFVQLKSKKTTGQMDGCDSSSSEEMVSPEETTRLEM